jgi:hypothetical protein
LGQRGAGGERQQSGQSDDLGTHESLLEVLELLVANVGLTNGCANGARIASAHPNFSCGREFIALQHDVFCRAVR